MHTCLSSTLVRAALYAAKQFANSCEVLCCSRLRSLLSYNSKSLTVAC